MNRKKKYLCLIASTALVATSVALTFLVSPSKSFSKSNASDPTYLDITAEQLEQAMNGDGTFKVGSYDTWKVENVAFFTENGDRYAKLDSTSAIYSTSTAGEESVGGLHGTGYTEVTIFNKKSTSSSYVYMLQDNGDAIYGSKGRVEIASGESDSYSVELLAPHAKRIKFSGVASGENSLSFTSLRLFYNCGESEGIRYENDGVYYWKRDLATDALSDKKFILWDEGEVVDGFRTDMGSDGKVMRNVSVWDGTSKSTSLSGTGSEIDPYLISSAADLAYFSDTVFGGNNYSGKYIKMTTSVDVNFNCLYLSGYLKSFAGHFNGNNNAILNDVMKLSGTVDGSANCVALFRTAANGASISNLIVSGSAVAAQHVGGFIGYSHSATISNCYNFVDVTANSWNVGGFVGNVGTSPVTINNSVNFGSVTGKGKADNVQVGGFVGNSTKASVVTNSTNFGTITAQGGLGGIIGQGTGTVTGCANFGVLNITGSSANVGDVVGKDAGVTITNCSHGDFATSVTNNNRKAQFTWVTGTPLNGIRVDTNEFGGIRTVSVWDGSSKSTSLSGTGSAADPYLINSAADLAYFADTASGGNTYSSKFIRLKVSVDLNNNPLTIGGYAGTVSFAGTFEGNNQFILGNKLTAENGTNGAGNCIGLFPTLANTSAVKDLAVDGTVSGETNIGGLIGINNSPTVENCYNFATVSATGANVGGIAGNTFNAGAAFTECYNFGAVGSTSTAESADIGGIVGRLIAKVENSENYATITAAKYVGGIVGQIVNGTVLDSYNFGEIKASTTAGGVVGDGYGAITNCKNFAVITATGGYAGGILGTQRTGKVTVSGCTNEGAVNCGSGSYAGGIIGALVTKADNVVSNCTNSGNITGGQLVGGIVGSNASWVTTAKVAFTDCTNSGTIKGSDYVGGIAGYAIGTYSTCTNSGTITCSGAHKGDLFGGGTITAA